MTNERKKRVLVTFGSKRGGTAEIAAAIAEALHVRGHYDAAAPRNA